MGTGKAIPGLSIERKRGAPLQTQLYQGIRKAVLQGRLQAGDRIPSTREVADFYGISRTTSRLVYEQLIDEGYLEGQRGAGTRISKKLPDVIELLPARERKKVDRPSPAGNLSKRGILLGKTPVTVARTFVELRPFRAWLPSFRDFPLELLGLADDEAVRTDARPGQAYHGYRYKVLTEQGKDAPGGAKSYIRNGLMTEGFALVAWPERYGDSGVMTFIVNRDGQVHQKNLGRNTDAVAKQMKAYNPDSSWQKVEPNR